MEPQKWADFCITGVKYHPPRTPITEVLVWDDTGPSLSNPRYVSRQAVVDALSRGATCVTAFVGSDGRYYRGEDVRVVVTPHGRFIRTDRDHTLVDNLNNLPEYA